MDRVEGEKAWPGVFLSVFFRDHLLPPGAFSDTILLIAPTHEILIPQTRCIPVSVLSAQLCLKHSDGKPFFSSSPFFPLPNPNFHPLPGGVMASIGIRSVKKDFIRE